MPIEMVWNDLKFYLTNDCILRTKQDLIRGIRRFWLTKANDLNYCNAKFDHIARVFFFFFFPNLARVLEQIIAVCGRATGL
jgi:hypothetical protein